MIQVKTHIGPSYIHGIGLFASENISKDTVIWKFTEGIDRWIDAELVQDLSKNEQDFIENAAVYDEDEDAYCLVADNVRFINHSEYSNCGETVNTTDEGLELFALRDIKKDEEITLNYNEMEEGSDDFTNEKQQTFNK